MLAQDAPVDYETGQEWQKVVDCSEQDRREQGLFEWHAQQRIDAGHRAVLHAETAGQH